VGDLGIDDGEVAVHQGGGGDGQGHGRVPLFSVSSHSTTSAWYSELQ
jgi:hypothetical protein